MNEQRCVPRTRKRRSSALRQPKSIETDVSRDGKQPFRSRVSATVSDGTRIYDAWWQQHWSRGLSRAFSPLPSPPLRCGGPKARQVVPFLPFPTGFALPLLYHSITMHAAETLVSSRIGGNARCTCSRLQPRLAPRNNTPAERLKHGGGSRARRIR